MSTGTEESSKWKGTDLWREIQQREGSEAESIRALLTTCMPDIETLLNSAGTSPADFTLHDAGHSFRVAQMMARVVPDDVFGKLSVYELALLLLSAYLHDVGMTPKRKLVSSHYDYLLTGKPEGLSSSEVEEFQAWLDDEAEGIAPPIASTPLTADSLRKALELTAHYCRAKHGDWGERWIRENEPRLGNGTYPVWLDDLINLCQSHLQGYEELSGERFEPRLAGGSGEIVNLRYLAAVLRVADVLEFDPERTPAVVFKHRAVSRESAPFWWKDHEISLNIVENRVVVFARPPNAQVHRAVELTLRDVEHELGLCRRLADGTHFDRCPGLPKPLPHRWDLLSSVYPDVRPRDDSYEYIDGSFRPDTGKLLQILSGTKLYGDKFAAVRELLQNAFDAVREDIAYERLRQEDPASEALEAALGKLRTVELRIDVVDDGLYLTCSDDGVGMTKAIIRDHLLVSGTAKRHDILSLERRCARAGFRLGRTGQFGIGVLSYFMLAKRVAITTRRAQGAGDSEPAGWEFETEGVGSFGALNKAPTASPGTTVSIQLREDVVGRDPVALYADLRRYLAMTLVHVPCRFRLCAGAPGCEPFSLGPGWVLSDPEAADFAARAVQRLSDYDDPPTTPPELLSNSRRAEMETSEEDWRGAMGELRSCITFQQTDGELPDRAGRYRIRVARFGLHGGVSLRFLRAYPGRAGAGIRLREIGSGYSAEPMLPVRVAWNGMAVNTRPQTHEPPWLEPGIIVEIDLESPAHGSISVSRSQLTLTKAGVAAVRSAIREARKLRAELARTTADSAYYWLNLKAAGVRLLPKREINWLVPSAQRGQDPAWGPMKFPSVSALAFAYEPKSFFSLGISLGEEAVAVVPCIGAADDGTDPYEGDPWNHPGLCPQRIVLEARQLPPGSDNLVPWGVVPVWTRRPSAKDRPSYAGPVSEFPPTWDFICGVRLTHFYRTRHGATIWNPAHPLLRLGGETAWRWCRSTFSESLDPVPVRRGVLSSPARAACWILMCLLRNQRDLWEGLRDRDPGFLQEVWRLALPGSEASGGEEAPFPVLQLLQHHELKLRSITPAGWATGRVGLIPARSDLERRLAAVSDDWVLRVGTGEASHV